MQWSNDVIIIVDCICTVYCNPFCIQCPPSVEGYNYLLYKCVIINCLFHCLLWVFCSEVYMCNCLLFSLCYRTQRIKYICNIGHNFFIVISTQNSMFHACIILQQGTGFVKIMVENGVMSGHCPFARKRLTRVMVTINGVFHTYHATVFKLVLHMLTAK